MATYNYDESIAHCESRIRHLNEAYRAACAERQDAEKRARAIKRDLQDTEAELALHRKGKLDSLTARLAEQEAARPEPAAAPVVAKTTRRKAT